MSVHNSNHDSVDKIFVGISWELLAVRLGDLAMVDNWWQKGSELHHQSKFLTITISFPANCEVSLIALHYIAGHVFFPCQECVIIYSVQSPTENMKHDKSHQTVLPLHDTGSNLHLFWEQD